MLIGLSGLAVLMTCVPVCMSSLQMDNTDNERVEIAVANTAESLQRASRAGATHILLTQHLNMLHSMPEIVDTNSELESFGSAIVSLKPSTTSLVVCFEHQAAMCQWLTPFCQSQCLCGLHPGFSCSTYVNKGIS